MIKAVLLDMDNTLLTNPDREFAGAFLALFEQHFHDTLAVENGAEIYRRVIKVLTSPRTGRETNFALSVRLLSDYTGHAPDEVEQALTGFYARVYSKLRPCISPVEGAASLIDQLRTMGYAVVIATNPIYPTEAIKQRMAWAGLPIADEDYALITSADNSHYAKPDSAYYAEIIARIGIEPDEALMVGDSMRGDILPAQALGLGTYSLRESSLQDFAENVEEILATPVEVEHKSPMIEPQLRGNIGAMYAMLEDVKPNFWLQRPAPDEWSVMQILCHLVETEDRIHRQRLLRILAEDNPFIIAPPPPGPNIEICADDGWAVAERFIEARQTTIELIQSLTATQWSRPARHSIFGLTTLLEMAYFTAQHDRLHVNQLCQTIRRCQ